MVFIEKQKDFINFPRGWQNSPGSGKIAPVYGTCVIWVCYSLLGIYIPYILNGVPIRTEKL